MNRILAILLCLCCSERALADANPPIRPRADILARACSGCHDGEENTAGPTPSLNGLSRAEFIMAMGDFKAGRRVSSIMNRIAKGYENTDFAALADYLHLR